MQIELLMQDFEVFWSSLHSSALLKETKNENIFPLLHELFEYPQVTMILLYIKQYC